MFVKHICGNWGGAQLIRNISDYVLSAPSKHCPNVVQLLLYVQ